VVLSVVGAGVLPVGAVGNAGLSTLIIANPVRGWQPEPTASVEHVLLYIDGLEADHVVPHGGQALTAVDGWRDPHDHGDYVVVALVALDITGLHSSEVAAQARQASVGGLASLCAGVASPSSVRTSTLARVPASHTLTCTLLHSTAAASPYAAGWARANVVALVLSTQGSLTPSTMAAIAPRQYAALPVRGYFVTAPRARSSSNIVVTIILGVLIVPVAGFVLWKALRTRDWMLPEPAVRRGVVRRPTSASSGAGLRPPRPPP
jgi:hypothetical protein